MANAFTLILISSLFTGAVMLLLCTYDKSFGEHFSPRKRTLAATLTLLLQPSILLIATVLSKLPTGNVTAEVTTGTFTGSFTLVTIPETAASVQTEAASTSPAFSLPDFSMLLGIFALIWLTGIAVTALYKIVSYLRFTHSLKKSLSSYEVEAKVPVFTSSRASSPFLMGFFRAKIILPDKSMDSEELELAIRHEMIHHKRCDIQKKFWVELLKCINWFNPAYYVFANKLSELSELTVDEILSSDLDYTGKKAYGGLLLRFASVGTGSAFCSELSHAASNLVTRLEVIMQEGKHKTTRKEKIALATLTVFIVAVVGLSIGICAAAMPEQEESTEILTIVPNDEIVLTQAKQEQRIIEIDESKTIESYAEEQDPVKGFSKLSDVGEKLDEDEIDGDIPTMAMYALSLAGNDTLMLSNIAYTNGQVMILGDDDMAISLSESAEVTIRIIPDFSPDYSNTDGIGEHAEVGYILDGKATEIFNGFIQEDGCEILFTAPESGEYQIYLINCSAGMQNYASVEVEIN